MLTAPLDTPRAAGLAADAWSAALLASLPDPWAADAPDVAGILSAVRRRGWDGLRAQPLPSRRQEAWRFTDLGALQAVSPSLLPPAALGAASAWPSAAPGTLVPVRITAADTYDLIGEVVGVGAMVGDALAARQATT